MVAQNNHKGANEYNFVEVLCDFDDVDGWPWSGLLGQSGRASFPVSPSCKV